MHLQSLELFGFKSFADKTVFNFHEGITAIVGPNGCGKSNVLDAVRWALGEQSAKSLRGDEMADVIFNGTDSRKPLGFAEVSLTFSDCEKELNVDWNEVRVTRRVYRDGNSEYLLNKTLCRLRDIQNLFADTGVARAAYSMMEQGKIDMILSSRPEDRRAVFEEAAGITKFKGQKREALRKLEATEANLLRIGDVIKEVKRQIGSLQRQAGKARRYQALHADLRVLETHHAKKQLAALETDLARCREQIETTARSEQEIRDKIDNDENALAEQRHGLDQIDIEISEARAAAQQLQSDIAAQRSRIEFNLQRAQELGELIERCRNDIAAAETKRASHAAQIKEADSLIEKTKRLLDKEETELAELTERLAEVRSEREARQTQRQKIGLSVSKEESRLTALDDEVSGLRARSELTIDQIRRLEDEIENANRAGEQAISDLGAAQAATKGEQQKIAELLAASDAAEASLRQQQQVLGDAEKDVVEVERTLAEKKSVLEVLRQLDHAGEGLAKGSQAVLHGMDRPDRFRSAVVGSLVSQIEVEPRFVSAIEVALGRNLHAIVLKDRDTAAEIIDRLTRKKLGQAALFVPNLGGCAHESVRKVLPQGALGWAIDKVTAPRSVEPLLRCLLNGVVIFPSLEKALACKKDEPTLAMATLDGEFVSSEGIVFGGSSEVRSDSLLERKARIAGLARDEADCVSQRDALLQKRDRIKGDIEAATQKVKEARARYEAAHIEQSNAAARIALLEREHEEAARKIDSLQSEKATLEQQIKSADEELARLQKEAAVLREHLASQTAAQDAAESEARKAEALEAETIEQQNELRLVIATERQRHENFVAQRQPMAARDTELLELIALRQADIASYEAKLATQADESRTAEAAIKEQTARCAEAEANAKEIMDQRAARSAAVHQRETDLRELRNSSSELQEQRGQQQVHASQLEMQIDNLAERIERRYQIDLRAFTPDEAGFEKTLRAQLKRRQGGSSVPPLDVNNGGEAASTLPSRAEIAIDPSDFTGDDSQKLIVDLTRQLDNMGPVNLDAVHEYDELEERYKFLENQNNDLTNSRRELLDVIARINSTTRKLFAETFAQVRANFREVFAELFGGGRADLALMDENDPLNCGIEITAKPPGKQLQSISLLSGGERAMVAVALLFSIYMVRPSPFCVLDEIDAPLDEGNINRFIHMLDRFVAQSQFVIITHNKRTIARADVLYGITMEERGVSKLVGMKLTPPPAAEQSVAVPQPISSQRQFAVAENGNGEKAATRVAR